MKDISNEAIFIKDIGVIEYGNQGKRTRFYIIECKTCGNQRKVQAGRYKLGKLGMCKNCALKEKMSTHGDSKNRIYSIWQGIKKRCYNHKDKDYKNYGAKGVTMCDEWLNSYELFKEWSLTNGYDENLVIDKDILCDSK